MPCLLRQQRKYRQLPDLALTRLREAQGQLRLLSSSYGQFSETDQARFIAMAEAELNGLKTTLEELRGVRVTLSNMFHPSTSGRRTQQALSFPCRQDLEPQPRVRDVLRCLTTLSHDFYCSLHVEQVPRPKQTQTQKRITDARNGAILQMVEAASLGEPETDTQIRIQRQEPGRESKHRGLRRR